MIYSMFLLICVSSLRTVNGANPLGDSLQIPPLSEPVSKTILNINPEKENDAEINANNEAVSRKCDDFNRNISGEDILKNYVDYKDLSQFIMGGCTTERPRGFLINNLDGKNDESLYSSYQKDIGFFYYTLKTTRLFADSRGETTESIFHKLALSRSNYTNDRIKEFEMAMNSFLENKSNITGSRAPSVQSVTTPRSSWILPRLFSKKASTPKTVKETNSSVADENEQMPKQEDDEKEETVGNDFPPEISLSNHDGKSNRARRKRSIDAYQLTFDEDFDNSTETYGGSEDSREEKELGGVNISGPSDRNINDYEAVRKVRKLNAMDEINEDNDQSPLDGDREGLRELTRRDSEERAKGSKTRGERKRGKQSGRKQEGRRRSDGRRKDKEENIDGHNQNEETNASNMKSDFKKSTLEALHGGNVTMKESPRNHISRRMNDTIKSDRMEEAEWSQPVNKLFKQLNKTIPIFTKNDTFNIVYGVPRAVKRFPDSFESTTDIVYAAMPNRNFDFNLPMKPREDGLMNYGSRPEKSNYYVSNKANLPPAPLQQIHPEVPNSPRFPNIAVLPKSVTNYFDHEAKMTTSDKMLFYSSESWTEGNYLATEDDYIHDIWNGIKKSLATEKKGLSGLSIPQIRIPLRNDRRQGGRPDPPSVVVSPPDVPLHPVVVSPPNFGERPNLHVPQATPAADADPGAIAADSQRKETTTKSPDDDKKYNIAAMFFLIFRNPLFWIVTIPILFALILIFVTMLILCRLRGACCRRFICCPPCCNEGAPSCNKKYKVILVR